MAKKQHLYEIDLMRGVIMLCVLSVHTLARFIEMQPQNVTRPLFYMGDVISSLHFTRESFMFITGLVLFVTYYRRDFRPVQFWKKRFLLVGIPYVVWTVVYILFEGQYTVSFDWSAGVVLKDIGHSLLFGDQFYLYYVLVTIQLYILFPFLVYALRRLERWHLYIFIGSFLFEVFLMYVTKFTLPHIKASSLPVVLRYIDVYHERFILTYQFWFVSGGIIACHYKEILAYFDRHKLLLPITLPMCLVLFLGHYVLDWSVLHENGMAYTVMQPIMVPYSLLVTTVMWRSGVQWARRRENPGWVPFSKFVAVASKTSFGIFLIQPFPLYLMETAIKHMHVPGWIHFSLIPVCVLFVYFSSMFVAYWIGKTPLLAYCVGQRVNLRRRSPESVSTAAS